MRHLVVLMMLINVYLYHLHLMTIIMTDSPVQISTSSDDTQDDLCPLAATTNTLTTLTRMEAALKGPFSSLHTHAGHF